MYLNHYYLLYVIALYNIIIHIILYTTVRGTKDTVGCRPELTDMPPRGKARKNRDNLISFRGSASFLPKMICMIYI